MSVGYRRCGIAKRQVSAACQWLAQGPCGQQHPIARPSTVEKADFNIAMHCVVLQPIVADDDIGQRVKFQECPGRLDPPPGNEHGQATEPRDEKRFITDLARIAFR